MRPATHSLLRILILVTLLIVTTACVDKPAPPIIDSPEVIPLVISETACETTNTAAPTDNRMPARPATLVGGDLLDEDQFTFDIWLYCDPDLSPQGTGPLLSEIEGLGVHLAWRYHGSQVAGHTESFLGFGDDNEPRATWEGGLTPGTVGSFTGGLRSRSSNLTTSVRAGTPISFKIIITVDDNTYGAALTFSMVPASDGYRPVKIVVTTLPQ